MTRIRIVGNNFVDVGQDAIHLEGVDEAEIADNTGRNIGGHGVFVLGAVKPIPEELLSEIKQMLESGATPPAVEAKYGQVLLRYGLNLAAGLGVIADGAALWALLTAWGV